MIPKVKRFYYYYYSSDFKSSDNRHSFIQQIAHANEFHSDETMSEARLNMFKRNYQLCQLLFEDEWDSRNGVIRYFIKFRDYELFEAHLTTLSNLLADFNETDVIAATKRSLQYYSDNIDQIKFLKDTPDDHPEWEQTLELLESKFRSDYSGIGIERITKRILENPDDFCVDENGKSIEKQFTGVLQTYYSNGNVNKKYAFVNGKVNGECMQYDSDGSLRSVYFYKSFRENELIKKWFKSGQLEFEKVGDEIRYWFDNGQLEVEIIGKNRKIWDESGNLIEEDIMN
jgi:hypothetical protein